MAKLGIYFTAGYPTLDSIQPILEQLSQSGADFIEIGIPFSDPLADGPVIQESSKKAIANGITMKHILQEVAAFHQKNPNHPELYFMGYLNTFLRFGMEALLEESAQCGITGYILPDLPIDYYQKHYEHLYKKAGIKPVFLVTPDSTSEYKAQIKATEPAFVYVVSSNSTTGKTSGFGEEHLAYFKEAQQDDYGAPKYLGFGISSSGHFDTVAQYFDGGIIGSAFIKALDQDRGIAENINQFVQSIRPITV